jgi:hypothetical protein
MTSRTQAVLANQNPGGDWNTPEAREVDAYQARYTEVTETRGSAFNRSTQKSADHPLPYLRRTARTFQQIEAGLPKLAHLPVRIVSPDDQVFPPENQERWRMIFPKAPPLIRLPNHSHVAQASEQGADVIAGAIRVVLDEAGRSAGPGGAR